MTRQRPRKDAWLLLPRTPAWIHVSGEGVTRQGPSGTVGKKLKDGEEERAGEAEECGLQQRGWARRGCQARRAGQGPLLISPALRPTTRTKASARCCGWEKAEGASLADPAPGCGPELHVRGRGYRMTASDLFMFMKNKRGKGARHGWDGRIQRFMPALGLCEGKVDHIWGQSSGLSPSL